MQYLRTSITVKEVLSLGKNKFVRFRVCLEDVTDVEFLCSSLRLFLSLIVCGRKESKYWFVRALIVDI